jgi:acyl carrier protein
MAENIEELVRKIISANCDYENVDEIDLDKNLQDLGINSVSFIKVVLAIEKQFDIEIDDENLIFEVFQTLRNIINYVRSSTPA